jgi:hypothetical protein
MAKFTGHKRIGPIVVYGDNAMHYAVNIKIGRGHLCFRPSTGSVDPDTGRKWWPWYVYYSPDATPTIAWWGFGPGFEDRDSFRRDKMRAIRWTPGHEANQ